MKILAITIGLVVTSLGLVGVVAPSLLADLGRSALSVTGLYVVAAVRIGIGIIFILAASTSRMPVVLRILGIVIVIAGVLTPLFGVERSRAMLDGWSSQGPTFMRACAGVAVAFGLFVVYAFASPRRTHA